MSDRLIATITPIDFHADQAEGRTDHGFINLWTRSLTKDDIDRLIEAAGLRLAELETGYLVKGPRVATYHYRGRALA